MNFNNLRELIIEEKFDIVIKHLHTILNKYENTSLKLKLTNIESELSLINNLDATSRKNKHGEISNQLLDIIDKIEEKNIQLKGIAHIENSRKFRLNRTSVIGLICVILTTFFYGITRPSPPDNKEKLEKLKKELIEKIKSVETSSKIVDELDLETEFFEQEYAILKLRDESLSTEDNSSWIIDYIKWLLRRNISVEIVEQLPEERVYLFLFHPDDLEDLISKKDDDPYIEDVIGNNRLKEKYPKVKSTVERYKLELQVRLSREKLQDVIEELRKSLDTKSSLNKFFVGISSRFYYLKAQEKLGTLNLNTYIIHRNKIVSDLYDLIEEMGEDDIERCFLCSFFNS